MPTRKEIAKVKAEFIRKRKLAIQSKLGELQQNIYEDILPDFLQAVKMKKGSGNIDQRLLSSIKRSLKDAWTSGFTKVMQETASSSKSLSDLNLMYFSSMLDSTGLDQIRDKTRKIVDKKLGIDQQGKLIPGGFIDKMISDESVQKEFIKETRRLIASNADAQRLKEGLKQVVIGGDESNGLAQRYYNSFASDLINNIDRSNSKIYADDIGLNYFYFAGGLIKTSRSFCIERNGKIISRDQAARWPSNSFIVKMYGQNIADYDPFTDMGGYGCLHSPDWITDDLAKGIIREQNKTAADRNKSFLLRNDL